MKLSIGIVGLPNVGKSTLFNALTNLSVPAENYPFCTIDPHVGIVAVKDERLDKIVELQKPEKVVPATTTFVDIAGLVKGAASGQGLGNQFLANIKETKAIIHVVRAFNSSKITHVENNLDIKRDIELINTELILKDIETLENKIKTSASKFRLDPKLKPVSDHLENLLKHLSDGKLAIDFEIGNNEDIVNARYELFLLTDKPTIYLVNATSDQFDEASRTVKEIVGPDKEVITMDIKLEAELSAMTNEEKMEFRADAGIEYDGLSDLTLAAYRTLGLISYFTSGPKEVRAWTILKGTNARDAAGEIHTDIANNFIAADVISWSDFVNFGGWVKGKEVGKVRLEGKTYIVRDGDVMLFKHNG